MGRVASLGLEGATPRHVYFPHRGAVSIAVNLAEGQTIEVALLAHAQQSLLCNTLHPVEARLARWLLRARDLCDSATVPLTQELLAQMIGVRRNAISLVAHSLQRASIIRYSRGQIEISDISALEATSCACYGAVKNSMRGCWNPAREAVSGAGWHNSVCMPTCTQAEIRHRDMFDCQLIPGVT
jgi:Crp-like helix-turn-helix domain